MLCLLRNSSLNIDQVTFDETYVHSKFIFLENILFHVFPQGIIRGCCRSILYDTNDVALRYLT